MGSRLLWDMLAARHVAELCVRGGNRNTHRSAGTYLTTVLRVPAIVADRICQATGELASRGQHDHFWYPAESLHVTALNLDPVADRIEDHDVLVRVADAMATCPPVAIRLTGLNVSNATIFAKAEVADQGLGTLRATLRHAAGLPAPSGTLAAHRDNLGAANVVRFGDGPIRPIVVSALERRHEPLGEWRADHVELVVTDKTLSPSATRVIARLPFASA